MSTEKMEFTPRAVYLAAAKIGMFHVKVLENALKEVSEMPLTDIQKSFTHRVVMDSYCAGFQASLMLLDMGHDLGEAGKHMSEDGLTKFIQDSGTGSNTVDIKKQRQEKARRN